MVNAELGNQNPDVYPRCASGLRSFPDVKSPMCPDVNPGLRSFGAGGTGGAGGTNKQFKCATRW
ncbi:MAG: hypothetical protein GY869_29715 [Planctomycetes bacterium]|nr:hypothetical protein [Planctomycetota bacterium]